MAEALHEDAHWLSEEEDDDALFDDVRSDVGSSVSSSWSVWEDQRWRGGRPVLTRFFYAWKYRCQLLDSRDLDRHAREQRRQVRNLGRNLGKFDGSFPIFWHI